MNEIWGGKSVCTGIPKESHPYDSAYNVQHVYISHTTHECTILTRARIFKIYHVCIRTYERTTCAFIYRKKNIRWMVAVFNRVSLSLCLSLFFLLVRVSHPSDGNLWRSKWRSTHRAPVASQLFVDECAHGARPRP